MNYTTKLCKIKIFIVLSLCILLGNLRGDLYSQNIEMDSAQIYEYIEKGNKQARNINKGVFNNLKIAILFSKLRRDSTLLSDAYRQMGNYFNYINQFDLAIHYCDSSLQFTNSSVYYDLGMIFNMKGLSLSGKADFKKALEIQEASKEAFESAKNEEISKEQPDSIKVLAVAKMERRVATALINIGLIHYEMGSYDISIKYSNDVLKMLPDSLVVLKGYALKTIGMISLKNGNYEQALEIFKEAETSLIKGKKTWLQDKIYEYVGKVHLAQGDYKKALEFTELAYNTAKANKTVKDMAIHVNNLGEIYFELKQFNKAKLKFSEALKAFEKQGVINYMAICRFNLSKVLVHQKKYTEAIFLLEEGLLLARESNSRTVIRDIYFLLGECYNYLKKYKKGYYYSHLHTQLSDSILGLENAKIISEMVIKYESEKKDSEIDSLRAEKAEENLRRTNAKLSETKNNLKETIYITVIVFLIIASLAIYSWKEGEKAKRKASELFHEKIEDRNRYKIAQLIKDNELDQVIADLNGQEKERKRIAKELHDGVGGSLASIKIALQKFNFSSDHEINIISDRLDDACEEVRTISHHLTPAYIYNKSFIKLLEQYAADIERNSNLKIKVVCYESEQVDIFSNELKTDIYRMVQELVTNIIKHANAKNVTIQLIQDEDYFSLMVEDDGKGFDITKKVKGIGFKNLKSRTAKLGGVIDIDSRKGEGTLISINLEIAKKVETA